MTAREEFEARLAGTLSELRRAGLLREMRPPRGIDLVSNDYLGLAGHPHLTGCMRDALEQLPAGSGGSRLLRGHLEAFEQLESRLAEFSGTGAALLFGSGYAANIGLLQAIVSPDDLIVSDRLNHASLIDAVRLTKARALIYPHQDLDALESALQTFRQTHGRGRAIVLTESVFSMDGDLTPLDKITAIAERNGGVVVVDEAHATGLWGARGSGRVEALGLRDRVLATMHTGGKSLGSGGAWVAGSRTLCDVLVNRARSFMFSTAPMPVLAAALGAGLDLIAREPERRIEVHRKSARLRRLLSEADVVVGAQAVGALAVGAQRAPASAESPILPIVVGSNESALALQSGLFAAGFDVRAIRPPTVPPGTARLRVTVRYPVSDEDLSRFAAAVSSLLAPAVPARQ
ncbi:MAG TPA: 8-amino-7-oxononanoate synthase [Vicinamibacterales bacterium]|jgi:8-amino-7-oxononanoate synthase|nr:8-amino-7-oxononanoate synthase [Vicinamibacterales bacterium]